MNGDLNSKNRVTTHESRFTFFIFLLGGLQFTAFGHIEEDPLSGFIDAQCLPLLIDMFDHQFGGLHGIGFEAPFPFECIFEIFEEEFGDFLTSRCREGRAEYGEDP